MTWDVLIETPSGWKVPNGDIDLPSALKRLSTRATHVHGGSAPNPARGNFVPPLTPQKKGDISLSP